MAMRVTIDARRPAFSTVYKMCAFCTAGYILVVYCLAGVAALFGKLHIDPKLGYGDLAVMLLAPVVVPPIFGLVLAVPGWALWVLYARFAKSRFVVYADGIDSAAQGPNKSPETNALPGQ